MSDEGQPLTITTVHGPQIAPHVPALAELRIAVFRDFPYLYDGDLAYEAAYLAAYERSPRSMFVLVFDGDRCVGASTAMPLVDEHADFQKPFETAGIEPARVFYLGESVLLPAYRGRGIGHRFFDERESYAGELDARLRADGNGGFDWLTFAAVDRPADHPLRPADHTPLDAFWQKRGYERRPELTTTFAWKQIDEPEERPHGMTFWTKQFHPR